MHPLLCFLDRGYADCNRVHAGLHFPGVADQWPWTDEHIAPFDLADMLAVAHRSLIVVVLASPPTTCSACPKEVVGGRPSPAMTRGETAASHAIMRTAGCCCVLRASWLPGVRQPVAVGVFADRNGFAGAVRCGVEVRGASGRRPIATFNAGQSGWPVAGQATAPPPSPKPARPSGHAAGSPPHRTPPTGARRSPPPSLPPRDAPAGSA